MFKSARALLTLALTFRAESKSQPTINQTINQKGLQTRDWHFKLGLHYKSSLQSVLFSKFSHSPFIPYLFNLSFILVLTVLNQINCNKLAESQITEKSNVERKDNVGFLRVLLNFCKFLRVFKENVASFSASFLCFFKRIFGFFEATQVALATVELPMQASSKVLLD